MKKRLFMSLISLFLIGTMAGCGDIGGSAKKDTANQASSSDTSNKKLKVGFTVMDLANPYFVQVADGFKSKAEELGFDVTVVDGKSDASTQISTVENFISQKMDVIVCAAADPKSIEPLVKKAHDAGIKFVASSSEIEGYDAWVTVPEYDYGYTGGKMAGDWIKNNLNGPVEVAILDYPEIKQVIDRANGIEKGILDMYPEAKVVARQSASSPEAGMKAAEAILQAHPNVKVISAINDAGALGAVEVAKSMGKGKDSDKFGVFGLDATPEALAKMKEGGLYKGTVDIDPKGMGGIIAETSLKLGNGGTLDDKIIKVKMTPVTQDK